MCDFLGELDNILGQRPLPWCIAGDFNLVRLLGERKGDRQWDSLMVFFLDFIDR